MIGLDLQRIVGDFKTPPATLRLRFGEVVSVQSGSITITVAGSSVEISGVRYLDSYTPTTSDVVALLTDGLDLLVLGAIA
jgi:hypothetical protein